MDTYNTEFAVGSFLGAEPVDIQAVSVTGTSDPADWFVDLIGGAESDSGERVDGYTALTSGPVWQAISILGGSVMSLPMEIIEEMSSRRKRSDFGKQEPRRTRKRRDLPAHRLIEVEPHPEYLPSTFKQLMTSWAALHGNAVGRLIRADGEPMQIVPFVPNSTYLERDEENQLWYMHRTSEEMVRRLGGNLPSEIEPLLPRDVFHIIGPHGGLWGTSLVEMAKNTIGAGLALTKHGNSTFKNAARPSGVLQKKSKMTPEQRRNLRKEWNEQHQGSDLAGNIAVLADDIEWKAMSVSNEDAQWLDALRHYRELIATWFGLPAHMLNALENSSVRANLEEQNKSFYFQSLLPWLIRWQDEIYRKLFTADQRNRSVFTVRFNAKALLASDLETQAKEHATGRQWGWYSANDVLADKGLDDIGEQGDIYMVPANMANAETGEPFGATSEPTPQPDNEEQPPGPPSSEEDETPNTLATLRPALVTNLKKVIRLESNKVKKAAMAATHHGHNFCAFLDEFYDSQFTIVATEQMEPILSVVALQTQNELDLQEMQTYADQSKGFWLTVAETSTNKTLYLDVTERLTKWQERAYLAADMLIESNENGLAVSSA